MTTAIVPRIVATINVIVALTMTVPMALSLGYGEHDWRAFLAAIAVALVVNVPVMFLSKASAEDLRQQEGMLIVTCAWLASCAFCALPFWFWGRWGGTAAFRSFTNCFFESASGLSTTGASVLGSVETLPHGILWWRSIVQWYGGMGIIVFTLALLPQLGIGGIHLYRAELPGPTADKTSPRLRDTAARLWKLYAGITLVEVAALCVAGMAPFDAFCHAFTTMATGGYSTKDLGLMAYAARPAVLVVLIVFMVIAGTGFSLHALALHRRSLRAYLADVEFRVYLALIGGVSVVVFALLSTSRAFEGPSLAFLHAVFNVVSLSTTTGYASADFEAWARAVPAIAVILFLCLFVGSMSGSTGGAIKTIRLWLLAKATWREIKLQVHPRAVFWIKVGNKPVGECVVQETQGFIALYVLTFIAGTVLVSLSGVDVTTAASAVASCVGNVGPGLGAVGPTENYAGLSDWVKWFLSTLMIVGRLELYTIYVLVLPFVRRV